ncbi:MAG TPA: Ig-like domain-containing protein [Phenylobacterium sp.]|nr:Ig-like domain-containing protein [Phenylobacterium sp.]
MIDAATVSELIVTASKTVAELTVTAKLKCLAPDKMGERAVPPRVVSTFPVKGAVVRPGLLIIRVTFNQPMACEGALTAAPPLENPCPGASQQMLLSYDRRTVRTVCVVEPSTQYGIWLSQDPTARSFLGLGGLPSQPYRLSFSTSAEPAVTTVCDAMVQDEDTARQIRKRRTLDCSSENSTSGG